MSAAASQGGPAGGGLSACGAIARRHDPDRFLAALFAPPARREAVFALIALHHELGRGVAIAAGATGEHGDFGARVRLQWWREVLDGAAPRHEVATPVAALLADGAVDRAVLHAMVDAGEAALSDVPDAAAWEAAIRNGPGGLARAIGQVLGVPDAALDRVAALGGAYAIGVALRRGRLPACVAPDRAIPVGSAALAMAGDGPRPPRAERAAWLLAPLARRDLARAAAAAGADRAPGGPGPGGRGLGDRFAVIRAGLFGIGAGAFAGAVPDAIGAAGP